MCAAQLSCCTAQNLYHDTHTGRDADRATSKNETMTRPATPNSRQTKKAATPPSPVKIKFYPPTLEEAVAAAQDIAPDDTDGQVFVAAGLMGVSEDEVREAVMAAAKTKVEVARGERVVVRDRTGSERAVVVQRAGRRAARAVVVERTRPAISRPTGQIRIFDLTRSG